MLFFRTVTSRVDGMNAWRVRVEAFYEMAEEIVTTGTAKALSEALREQNAGTLNERDEVHGLRIASLSGVLARGVTMFDPGHAVEVVDGLSDLGCVFDLEPGTYSTARNLLGWLKNGGSEKLFPDDEGPFETDIGGVFVSEGLYADPFVDRGAVLAMMMAQLDQFSRNRLLCVHEEGVEEDLSADQRDRITERMRTFNGASKTIGLEVLGLSPGVQARGKQVQVAENDLGEPVALPGQLPLFVMTTPAKGLPRLPAYIDEDLELTVLDVADWYQARFGASLDLDPDPEPDPF